MNHDIQQSKEPWPDEVSDLPEVQPNNEIPKKEKESVPLNSIKKEIKEKKEPVQNKPVTKNKETNKPEVKKKTSRKIKEDKSQKTDESSNTIEWDLTDDKSEDDEQMKLF